jgi:hypothetical protein
VTAAAWVLCALLGAAQVKSAAPAAPQSFDELSLEGARDMSGEGRAFVETVIDGDSFYLQQPIKVRVRLGVERPFLEKDMLQLFRQPLDIPAQLQAPWFDALQNTLVRKPRVTEPDDAAHGRRLTFAFDEKVRS